MLLPCFVGWSLVSFRSYHIDAEDLISVLWVSFDLEDDFITDFQGIVHRFLSDRKCHRHRAHETRDRLMLDLQLAFSDSLNHPLTDLGRFTRPIGRRFSLSSIAWRAGGKTAEKNEHAA